MKNKIIEINETDIDIDNEYQNKNEFKKDGKEEKNGKKFTEYVYFSEKIDKDYSIISDELFQDSKNALKNISK